MRNSRHVIQCLMLLGLGLWTSTGQAADDSQWSSVMAEADRYMYGQGIPQDRGQAASRYEKACSAGVSDACAELTEILYWGHPAVPKDQARAIQLMTSLLVYLEEACRNKNPRACLRLGAAYADGIGVAQDRVRAAELDVLACDGGFLEGCFYLGVAYAKARGVKEDHAKAADLYRRSCEGGYAAGCASLAEAHRAGAGVPKDAKQAAELERQACEHGLVTACPKP